MTSRWPPSPPPGVSRVRLDGSWPPGAISRSSAGAPRLETRRWRPLARTSTEARWIWRRPCGAARPRAGSPPDPGPTSRSSAAPSIAPSARKWLGTRPREAEGCDATGDEWIAARTARVRHAGLAGAGRRRGPCPRAPGSGAGARPRSECLHGTGDVRAVVDAGARARVERAADRRTDRRDRDGAPADAVRRRHARAVRGSRGLLGQPPWPGLLDVLRKRARLCTNAEERRAHTGGAPGGDDLPPL